MTHEDVIPSSPPSMSVNIAIIGTGVVGTAFVNQVKALKSAVTYNVVYLARLKTALVSTDYAPINLATWELDLQATTAAPLSLPDLAAWLRKSPVPAIVVDNTSNESVALFLPTFLDHGILVATPNKKAFSLSYADWEALFPTSPAPGRGLVYHEATVGAGLPIISTVKDLVATGDLIELIEGIFSGTLLYLFNQFLVQDGKPVAFSEVVNVAKLLGYTEPDPRDDLNGLDVARKVTILARLAGLKVELPTLFPVDLLIPGPLELALLAAEFLEKLPLYDEQIAEQNKQAAAAGKVLRFVGSVDVAAGKVLVGINQYSFDHPFAALKGSDNVIAIKTKRYQNPLIVQGAGAGAEVTAAGVLADVLKIGDRVAKL